MKKIFFNSRQIAAFIAIAIVAVGCTEDYGSADDVDDPVVYPEEPEAEYIEGVRVTATALAPVISRGHLEEGDDATTYVWDAITTAAEGDYMLTTAIVTNSQGTLLSWNKGDAFTASTLTIGEDGVAALETELPVCEDDIDENGEFVDAGYPYIYVMQSVGEVATNDSGELRFKIENPFVGSSAIDSDATISSLEPGMSVYATGSITEALSQSASDLGEVQFEMIPSIMMVNVNNGRSSQKVNISDVKIAATQENGTEAATFASVLYLDATYVTAQKSFTFAYSEDSATEYSAELSSSELATSSLEAGESATYYYMALPTDALSQSTAVEWTALTARVTYTIDGSDEYLYLAKLKVASGEAPFEAGTIAPSQFYAFDLDITATDILAEDEVEELGENTVRSVAGELDSIMATKFGSDYRDDTLDYVEVLGEMAQVDFESLQNVRDINLGSVVVIDGDYSNVIADATFGSTTASEANLILEKITLPKDITNIGIGAFENCSALQEVVFPTAGNYVIGNRCFKYSGLKSLYLGSNCKQINYAAFTYCESLESIVIDGLTNNSIGSDAFNGCSMLSSVKLPSGITIINSQTFANCSMLASFDIPATVTSIDMKAFANTAITSIEFPGAISYLGNGAYQNCLGLTKVEIPETITSISTATPGTFSGCTNLTDVTVYWLKTPPAISETFLPTSFEAGGENAVLVPDGIDPAEVYNSDGWENFNKKQDTPYENPAYVTTQAGGLEAAMKAKYGDSYQNTTIDYETVSISGTMNADDFAAIQNITSLNLSLVTITSVEYTSGTYATNAIPMYAFGAEAEGDANTVLEEIVLPSAMSNLGYGAFMNCLTLNEITFPATTTYVVRNFALANTGIEEFTFGTNLTSLAYKAMFGSTKTKKVTFQNPTTVLGGEAMSNCTLLEEVILPSSLSKLDNKLFSACPALSKVSYYGATDDGDFVIPSSVATMSNGVFYNCTSLNNVVIPATVTELTSATPGAFNGCSSLTSFELKWTANPPAAPTDFLPSTFYLAGGDYKILIPDDIEPSIVYGSNGWETYGTYQINEVIDERVVTSAYAGGLDAAMMAKFGDSYASTTIDEVIVKGVISTDDFAALQNIKIVDLSNVFITDIDHDNNSSSANIDNAIPPYAFNQNKLTAVGEGNTVLERIVMPASVTSIGFCAFGGCTALTDMDNFVLPTTAYFSLQNRSLDLMYLTELVIPDNCTSINYRACANNTNLKSVSIGNVNMTGFVNEVFYGCTAITSFEVVWGGEGKVSVPTIAEANYPLPSIFYADGGSQYIKIPDGDGVYEAYQSAGWSPKYNLYNAQNPK